MKKSWRQSTRLSYVVLTHNRREALLQTLRVLTDHTPLPAEQWEAIVVDNASTDGAADAVRRAFPNINVLLRPRNEGSPARNIGARCARGEVVIFLDDDSYPCGDTVRQCLDYFDAHYRVGTVGGPVYLPDGSEDAAALPIVMPACALCVRREAFMAVGGFCSDFFRQAEEYDLIFRMLEAGWDVRRLPGLIFRHEKVATSRNSELIYQMDLQNNLVLSARFLPRQLRSAYRHDWLQRYTALARHAGCEDAVRNAIANARQAAIHEAHNGRLTLDAALVEVIFQLAHQQRCVAQWAEQNHIRRVVIADYTKNLYATWRACRLAGLEIAAVCDNHPAYSAMQYRGIDIVTEARASRWPVDGVVLSNINPARINQRLAQLRHRFGESVPILHLWDPPGGEHHVSTPQQEQHWRNDQYPRLAV